jgi:hypothetical protein
MTSEDKSNPLQTEFAFTLPKGFLDTDGALHREGVMRLATAMDEIAPMRDRRVRDNPAYLNVLLLSRVVTRLGTLQAVDERLVENLFSADLAYLQTLYQRINSADADDGTLTCPKCQHTFPAEVGAVGE